MMTNTVWIKVYDAIAIENGDIFRGNVPADFAGELTYDGDCIYDADENMLHDDGLGAYVEPRSNVDWGMPYNNTVRFDDKLKAFLLKYEEVNKVRNWRKNLPANFSV